MEGLTRSIDEAIQSKDYATLSSVFSPSDDNNGNNGGNGNGGPSWHAVGQGEKRSLAAHFLQASVSTGRDNGFLPEAFGECEEVFLTALGHLPATVEGAADTAIRSQLFDYKVAHSSEYAAAARILAGTRMMSPEDEESGSGGGGGGGGGPGSGSSGNPYNMQPVDKLDVHVRVAECFLEEDEIAEADAAVNRAGLVAPLVSTAASTIPATADSGSVANDEPAAGGIQDKQQHRAVSLLLRYKSTYARVLDANRKFLQAAQRYHELSQQTSLAVDLDEDDLLQLLGRAVTCAILAPSGPQRQRVLRHLYQDSRLRNLDEMDDFSSHATILSKMYHHQVLRPSELTRFESSLADHQKAVMGDGLTIMERGIVEHNMTAVSRLYRTIYVTELATILGVTPPKAQKIAAAMILDGTIRGNMDQVAGLLEFEAIETPAAAWDRSISSFCLQLNSVTDSVKQYQQQQSTAAQTAARAQQQAS